MPVEKSKQYYRGKEGYNCAQAIAAGFCEHFDGCTSFIEECKMFSGGRAKEGLCGALFAAETIATDQDKAFRIRKKFREEVGAVSCREIKSTTKTPCISCVETAARILKEEITNK